MIIKHGIPRKYCVIEKIDAVDEYIIKNHILEGNNIYGDFRVIDAALPMSKKTSFKVYETENDIVVAVCIHDIYSDKGELVLDDIEILFDLQQDRIGFYQFVFSADGKMINTHHQPYEDAHSTAFKFLQVKDYKWHIPENHDVKPNSLYNQLDCDAWLFAVFEKKEVFKHSTCCGFNVARNCRDSREAGSWNPSSGVGIQDANSFGNLYLEKPDIILEDININLDDDVLSIKGKCPDSFHANTFKLLDPAGNTIEISSQTDRSHWFVTAKITAGISGRYRLISELKTEPEYICFDLSFRDEKKNFNIGMLYDFPDDINMIKAPHYTPEMLSQEFDLLISRGVQRLYWIDYHPPPRLHEKEIFEKYCKSEECCNDLLSCSAKLAKEKGMEFIGIMKPYDISFISEKAFQDSDYYNSILYPENKPIHLRPEFLHNQASTMSLNPAWWPEPALPITRVCFYSELALDTVGNEDIELYYSEFNQDYQKYNCSYQVHCGTKKRPHCRWTPAGVADETEVTENWHIEISGLNIQTPYLAIRFKNKKLKFQHRVFAFAEAFDKNNIKVWPILSSNGDEKNGFSYWREWVSWCNRTPRLLEHYTAEQNIFGLCFKAAKNLPLMLEPSSKSTHQIWLNRLERIFQSEATGASVRLLCHHNFNMDFMMYAYAAPVRERFKEIYGREVTPSWNDSIKIREIRGNFYTDFIRKAKRLAESYGKKLLLHLEAGIELNPTLDLRMQFYEDWQTWIQEGLADELILKWWHSQSPFIHEQVLPLAKKQGIPVHICDRNQALKNRRCIELTEHLIRDGKIAGFSGFFFYEMGDYKYWNSANKVSLENMTGHAIQRAAETAT